jgi:hypothetical protein
MSDSQMRKGGGGKLSRSETVTVRFDPKLRYLCELAARRNRRTLSSFIEATVKAAIDEEPLRPVGTPTWVVTNHTVGNEAEYLWDVDEADRLGKLALRYPDLLTHDEEVLWKLICENGYVWAGLYAGLDNQWVWAIDEGSLIYKRLREHWETFRAVADGKLDESSLPSWPRSKVPASDQADELKP